MALSAPLKVPVHEGAGGFTESPQPQGATVVGHAGHEGRSNWSLRRNHAMGSQVHARDSAAWRDVAGELYAARVTTGVVRFMTRDSRPAGSGSHLEAFSKSCKPMACGLFNRTR